MKWLLACLMLCALASPAIPAAADPLTIEALIDPSGMVTDDFWVPVYVPDQAATLVTASRSGRDTTALFSYDVNERRRGEMLVGHPSQDILSWQGIDQEAMHYVATTGMKPEQIWFTRAWRQMQASLAACGGDHRPGAPDAR